MKLITALHIALIGAVALTGCVHPPDQHPKWKHVTQIPKATPPRGKVVMSENGSVLTLPNGKQYVSRKKDLKTTLTFPNQQVFSAETAKGGFEPPYVSDDESLVASVIVPATKSGDLHLFIAGQNGKSREIADVNGKLAKVLKAAGAPFGADALRIQGLKGRTLSLAAIDYGKAPAEADLFDIEVARDGTLSLGH